jgi:hypothetical protein
VRAEILFLRGNRKLKVDLGDLKDASASLSSFLSSKLEAGITSMGNMLFIYSDSLSSSEFKRLVNKFVYHHHLNHTYWVGLEGDVVKLHKFKHATKKGKQKEGAAPSTIKHGW